MPTIAERVVEYLRSRPDPICADCLTKALDLSRRQQVNPIVEALGLTRDFNRYEGGCSYCGDATKKVICRA